MYVGLQFQRISFTEIQINLFILFYFRLDCLQKVQIYPKLTRKSKSSAWLFIKLDNVRPSFPKHLHMPTIMNHLPNQTKNLKYRSNNIKMGSFILSSSNWLHFCSREEVETCCTSLFYCSQDDPVYFHTQIQSVRKLFQCNHCNDTKH